MTVVDAARPPPAPAGPGAPPRAGAEEAARLTARVTAVSVAAGCGLMLVKAAAWRASGSVALLSSTADSGLDFLAALASFWAVRYAVRAPDAEHRYGHGKAEAFASLLQAALVFASAALIAREAVTRFLAPRPLEREALGVGVMAGSLLVIAALVAYQGWVVKRTRSLAVAGDRAHYLADFVSNTAAIAGVALARLTGEPRWDAVAGLAVAAWLVWGAVGVLRAASQQLLDREVDDADRAAILQLALDDARVLGVHQFRTRASGPHLHVQMHMELEADQTLTAAHEVIEAAEERILSAFPGCDLIIHADPHGLSEEHDREYDAHLGAVAPRDGRGSAGAVAASGARR